MKKKKKKSNLIFILIFILGFLILMYPQISDLYYRVESNNVVNYFDEEKSKMSKEESDRRFDLALAYNKSLINNIDDDPYDDKKKEAGRAAYAQMLEIKEYIGHVEVPNISQDIPIYAGTSEEILQKGAGHLEGTSLPIGGKDTHTVITAHTGLPSKKLFTDLDKIKEGDIFYIHNFREVLAYKVDQIKVIEPMEFDDLMVSKDKDYATLLTCTPYMVNTHRLIVRGERIPYDPEEHKSHKNSYNNIFLTYLFYWLSFVISIIISLYILKRRKKKKDENKESK
ncbi:class C sortase [Gemelliphila palaticanis]|uniref:Class C sortase n=1 Tax=Gemelliphila palaticanis TaxID=81950 RepID=A0ABX2SY81_9BACL|nr:class C sortase [Gemella palaticanis]MBF0715204.1 class C sortase [Gemella palaticanis]NYS47134.1 class C sortase [Gemella palaticanis]